MKTLEATFLKIIQISCKSIRSPNTFQEKYRWKIVICYRETQNAKHLKNVGKKCCRPTLGFHSVFNRCSIGVLSMFKNNKAFLGLNTYSFNPNKSLLEEEHSWVFNDHKASQKHMLFRPWKDSSPLSPKKLQSELSKPPVYTRCSLGVQSVFMNIDVQSVFTQCSWTSVFDRCSLGVQKQQSFSGSEHPLFQPQQVITRRRTLLSIQWP